MKCISIFENSRAEAWDVYSGMDPIDGNELNQFDTREEAIAYGQNVVSASTILVVESGELAGYTQKFEQNDSGYVEA